MAFTLEENQEVISSGSGVATTWRAAQTFTASSSYSFTAISLFLGDLIDGAGTVTVGVYDTAADKPTGAALATASFAVPIVQAWIGPIELSVPVALTSGMLYAIVIDTPVISLRWYGDINVGSDDYTGGEPFIDIGAGWVEVHSPNNWSDRGFRVYSGAAFVFSPPADIVTTKRLVAFSNNTLYYEGGAGGGGSGGTGSVGVGGGYDTSVDVVDVKRLVAFSNNTLFYEDV